MDPAAVSCDFEPALINAVKSHFKDSALIGCLFHWKQAVRKKMINFRIPTDQIKEAMNRGVINLLAAVSHVRMKEAVVFVKGTITTTGHEHVWTKFWLYFEQTWMKRYSLSSWNISQMRGQIAGLINHTNNPLESYNRYFGEKMERRNQPDLLTFVQVMKEELVKYLRQFNDVRAGIAAQPTRAPPSHPSVPSFLQ
ncbi:hypothetical protein BBJ28_00017785 [Nothophytophthora sp. Chile5]|nr:hypothetical protein BBJ28_00017785 [Nothophytophthora sp. Chile5]